MIRTKKSVKVYETLEDLVDDLTRRISPNIKLDNVKWLFFYFGCFLTLFVVVFVMDILFKQHKIHRKLIYSRKLIGVCKNYLKIKFRRVVGSRPAKFGSNLSSNLISQTLKSIKRVLLTGLRKKVWAILFRKFWSFNFGSRSLDRSSLEA